MLQKIQQSIQEAQSRGYKLGEYFNAVIIPSHLLEEFEKDLEAHLVNNTNDSRTTVFGLEVLICGKNEQIRFGKIF
jgi:carbonic anhydrase